jgi:hypothetical protein
VHNKKKSIFFHVGNHITNASNPMPHLTCYCLVFGIYLLSSYLFSYIPIYILDLFLTKLATKVKSNIKLVKVHPQLSYNNHPMDCVLVGVDSPWSVQALIPTNCIHVLC